MSPEPVTAQYIYEQLKAEIVAAAYTPGRSLNLNQLAQHFGTSITPVRDAIHRMVGERLVDLHPGGGFRIPVQTSASLHALYRWHDALVRQAMKLPLSAGSREQLAAIQFDPDAPQQIARAATCVFEVLAGSSGNTEYIYAIANAADRLFRARLHECYVMKAVPDETLAIISIAQDGSVTTIRSAVWEYHRRRIRRSDKIAAVMSP
jgi:DNA-binding GntR family transcriptional regulator